MSLNFAPESVNLRKDLRFEEGLANSQKSLFSHFFEKLYYRQYKKDIFFFALKTIGKYDSSERGISTMKFAGLTSRRRRRSRRRREEARSDLFFARHIREGERDLTQSRLQKNHYENAGGKEREKRDGFPYHVERYAIIRAFRSR